MFDTSMNEEIKKKKKPSPLVSTTPTALTAPTRPSSGNVGAMARQRLSEPTTSQTQPTSTGLGSLASESSSSSQKYTPPSREEMTSLINKRMESGTYYPQDQARPSSYTEEQLTQRKKDKFADAMRSTEREFAGKEKEKIIPDWMKKQYEPGVVIRGQNVYRKFLEGPLAGAEYLETGEMPVEKVRGLVSEYKDMERPKYIDRPDEESGMKRYYHEGPLKDVGIPEAQLRPGGAFGKEYEYAPETSGGYKRREEEQKGLLPVRYKTEGFEGEQDIPGFYDPQEDKWIYSSQPQIAGLPEDSYGEDSFEEGSVDQLMKSLMDMSDEERNKYLDNLQKTDPKTFLLLSRAYLGK